MNPILIKIKELQELIKLEETPISMKKVYHEQIMYYRRKLSLAGIKEEI